MMHAAKKSDAEVVATKAANNGVQARMEPLERRAGSEGNAGSRDTGVVFQFVSVDFTKLFHELVRSLFELVHYCRRELRPGKGPVEPYVSVKLATVTLSCSSELIHKIPRPCIGII